MQETTIAMLKEIAPHLIRDEVPVPCPVVVQRAILILDLLRDGEWHTARAIAEELDMNVKYTRQICQTCKQPWGLQSHRGKGWLLAMPQD
jgi:hypothetical protein